MTDFDFESFSKTLRCFLSPSDSVVLYNVRVMFKFKDSDTISFKILTDTQEGIEKFIESVSNIKEVVSLSYEYLSEYKCSLLGQCVNVFNREV